MRFVVSVFAAAGLAASTLLTACLFLAVPPVAASGAAGPQAAEAVRLIDGARAAAGKTSLKVDPFLADKATGGSIPCPDNSSRSIDGRTRDFATYGQMSHYLRLCDASGYAESSVLFITTMGKWGYVSDGEILTYNRGYGTGKYLFKSGTFATWTYSTTGHAVGGWLGDAPHRNIILGSYDRIGCGAWLGGSIYYYACEFSRGGSSPDGLQPPPTEAPFPDPVPGTTASTKTAKATAKTATAKPKDTAVPGSTALPSPSPVPGATPTGTPSPAAGAADAATPDESSPRPSDTAWPAEPAGIAMVGGATDDGSPAATPADSVEGRSEGGGADYYRTLIMLVVAALGAAGAGAIGLSLQARRSAANQGQHRHPDHDAGDAAPLTK